MSDTTDDIHDGLICMQCLTLLISDAGEVFQCGHPVHCRECYLAMSKKERRGLRQWFDPKTWKVVSL